MSCPCLRFEEGTGSFIWFHMPGNCRFGGSWCVPGVLQSCWKVDVGMVGAEVKSGILGPGKAMTLWLTAPKSALKLPQQSHELI